MGVMLGKMDRIHHVGRAAMMEWKGKGKRKGWIFWQMLIKVKLYFEELLCLNVD